MIPLIRAQELRRRWRHGEEVALLDAREELPYSQSHPLFAVSLPLGRLEERLPVLVPRPGAPLVFYDDGEGLAARAARRARMIGYGDVRLLKGGLTAYGEIGELYRDVNVPSKAFGELVESIRHTPSIAAVELKALQNAGAPHLVVDARRAEEFRTMSIPGGYSLPGGELVLRIRELAPDPSTLVVVNCAGRTRSIIGAQSLIDAGVPNRVVALRNGTIGWTLAGLELSRGIEPQRHPAGALSRDEVGDAAARWATRCGVPVIGASALERLREDGSRTLYQLDVRQRHEYLDAHPRGFRSAPGGQLVQATDEWIAVRGARIVLWDDDGVRARMAAAWLRQMGWDALVVAEGMLAADESGPEPRLAPAPPPVEWIAVDRLDAERSRWTVLDLAQSAAYRAGHLPGAVHALRSALAGAEILRDRPGSLVLTSPDGEAAAWAAAELEPSLARPLAVLAGGTGAWRDSGRPLSAEAPSYLAEPNDAYKRPYEGTDNPAAAMQAYIDWELQLVAQLANDGVSGFRVVRASLPRRTV